MTSVPSVLSPAVDPPPDELEMAIRKKKRIEQVERSLAHVRARPHIFEREVCHDQILRSHRHILHYTWGAF